MDPGTAMMLAAAVQAAFEGGGSALGAKRQKKADKAASKEMKRATYADLLDDTRQRQAELEGQRYTSRSDIGKRRNQALMNTAASVREAFRL